MTSCLLSDNKPVQYLYKVALQPTKPSPTGQSDPRFHHHSQIHPQSYPPMLIHWPRSVIVVSLNSPKRLSQMARFYLHSINMYDFDIRTITWTVPSSTCSSTEIDFSFNKALTKSDILFSKLSEDIIIYMENNLHDMIRDGCYPYVLRQPEIYMWRSTWHGQ